LLHGRKTALTTSANNWRQRKPNQIDTPQTEEERQRSQKLMATMDALNEKMGKGTVRLGLPEKNAPWHLRCANRSPRYTTNWDELMVAYTDEGAAKQHKIK